MVTEITKPLKAPKGMKIGCYGTSLIEKIYAQEGIDFKKRNTELSEDYYYKLTHLEEYSSSQKNPIPLISHQIYFTAKTNSRPMNKMELNKTITNINRLNEVSDGWRHMFWTNDESIVPEEIKSLKNMEIHLIDELKDNILWDKLMTFFEEKPEFDKRAFSGASNLVRYIVIQKFGGMYHDLDYEIYNAKLLLSLMQAFNFLSGKEFTGDIKYVGNAFIAAKPNHPILDVVIQTIENYLHSTSLSLPEYVRFPCTTFNYRMFTSGPALFTLAIYKAANQGQNIDFVAMDGNMFFNVEYARYTTPDGSSYRPKELPSLINYSNGTEIVTVGSDLFRTPWPDSYEELIYYPEHRNLYLYVCVENNDLENAKNYVDNGADVNAVCSITRATPLQAAAERGYLEMVDYLIKEGADLEIAMHTGATALSFAINSKRYEVVSLLVGKGAKVTQSMLNRVQALKDKKLMKILHEASPDKIKLVDFTKLGCFDGDISDIFEQEGLDYYLEDKKLIADYKKNSKDIEKHKANNKNPIPLKTHQIYFSFGKSIDEVSTYKTVFTLNRLSDVNENWEHNLWINDVNAIPEEIKNIDGIKIRLIDELKDVVLYKELNIILNKARDNKAFFAQASDIARVMVVYKEGGLYRDLDNEIHRPKEVTFMLQAYNFFGGKEKNREVTFIGNAFFAATPGHPILKTSIYDFLVRNLNEDLKSLPEYLQYPCYIGAKVIYETGSPVLTYAYYKSANQNGNVDVVAPGNVFFHTDYARYTSPGSTCYNPNQPVEIDSIVNGEKVYTYASDRFCGGWNGAGLLRYPENKDIYLYLAAERGDVKDFMVQLEAGADVDTLRVGEPPIYIATKNNREAIVRLLLQNGAKMSVPYNGKLPEDLAKELGYNRISQIFTDHKLSQAAFAGDVEAIEYHLDRGADVNSMNLHNETSVYIAAKECHGEAVKLLINRGADVNVVTIDGDTALHASAAGRCKDVFTLLLDAEANKEIGSDGHIPLFVEKYFREIEALKYDESESSTVQEQDIELPQDSLFNCGDDC